MEFRPVIHLLLHVLAPYVVARIFYPQQWKWVWLIMMFTMVIDLDHLLANPIYDASRCGIGFHPLHSWPVIVFYFIMLAVPKLRTVALGLVIHIALDSMDCVWLSLERSGS